MTSYRPTLLAVVLAIPGLGWAQPAAATSAAPTAATVAPSPESPTAALESSPTSDGVKAIEEHWSRAFITGDVAFLDGLLAPDYVSVSSAGVPRDRGAVIALAQANASKPSLSPPAPVGETISVYGNTALVRFASPSERSVDVFYYADGRWHACHSQHTAVTRRP